MEYKKNLLPLLCLAVAFIIACVAQKPIYLYVDAAAPTPPSNQVVVTIDKTQYTTNETISVTINNGLPTAITSYQYKTQCTIVFLQQQDAQGKWLNTNHCRVSSLQNPKTLASQSAQAISLSPPSRNFGKTAGKWQPGTYRIAFSFGAEGNPLTKSSTTYSPTFVIA